MLAEPEPDKPGNRFNDGKCDRQGRLWAGTMGDVEWDSPIGSLYRFDADNKVTRMEEGIACSNGLGWSPDSKTMYFSESFRYRIFAYDFDAATGNISNRRVFATRRSQLRRFPRRPHGRSRGLRVERAAAVRAPRSLRSEGKDRAHHRAAGDSRGTSCMFGGENLDVLYVTTMRATLTDEQLAEEPLAGSLLALRPGVQGIAETPFAG